MCLVGEVIHFGYTTKLVEQNLFIIRVNYV